MRIWKGEVTVEALNDINAHTMDGRLGIEFIEVGDDYLRARMPVSEKTTQPMGLLHGGASVVMAEGMGSLAGYLCVNQETHHCVGVEVNANHVRPVREGYVYGEVRPIRIGRTIHVWGIEITNESGKLVCVSRLTLAVVARGDGRQGTP